MEKSTKERAEDRMLAAIKDIPESERITYNSIKYGQLVQAYYPGGRLTSVKVHFFNEKGVLVGNVYEFLPYGRLRLHEKGVIWERVYYNQKFERLRFWGYKCLCLITTRLIRITQSICK